MTPGRDASKSREGMRSARQLLSECGFDPAALDAAGQTGEIAVLNLAGTLDRVPAPQIAQIGRMTAELKELGFRYVAIDITDAGVAAEKEDQRSHDQEPRQEPKDK